MSAPPRYVVDVSPSAVHRSGVRAAVDAYTRENPAGPLGAMAGALSAFAVPILLGYMTRPREAASAQPRTSNDPSHADPSPVVAIAGDFAGSVAGSVAAAAVGGAVGAARGTVAGTLTLLGVGFALGYATGRATAPR